MAVDFTWFEYVPPMEAYAAGEVDAVCVTNGDALVTGNGGAPSVAILVNDYSSGNDMVVARPASPPSPRSRARRSASRSASSATSCS
ncbi:hypothetical protein WMF23_01545 [Sorangium sp. So ce542]